MNVVSGRWAGTEVAPDTADEVVAILNSSETDA